MAWTKSRLQELFSGLQLVDGAAKARTAGLDSVSGEPHGQDSLEDCPRTATKTQHAGLSAVDLCSSRCQHAQEQQPQVLQTSYSYKHPACHLHKGPAACAGTSGSGSLIWPMAG